MRQFIKTRIARITAAIALLVALYALAGFVIAPKLARSALLEDIPKTLVGVTPSVGDIHINPFLLQVEVKDFALAGHGGEKLVGFERLFLNFELSSLWHRDYSFGRIEINAPYANAQVAKDGTLNLLALRPKPPERIQTRAEKGALPAVHIGSFKVTRGTVSYDDRGRATEFADRLEPIEFELYDFSTGVEGGLFNFRGSSKLGEKLEWHGHLSIQPIESDGELRIEGLRARTIWEYLEDRLNFVVNSGSIDVTAAYRFALKEAVDLQLTISKVAVTDFAMRPRNSDLDWISVPALTLSAASVDLSKRRAQVDSLSLTGVKVAAWREPDGSINLLALAAAPAAARSPAPAATPPPAATPAPAAAPATVIPAGTAAANAPWQFELGRFELGDASIAAEDRTTNPIAKVALSPLSVEVRGVSLDLSKPVHLKLDTRINQTGSIAASGDVTPQPLAASLSLKLAGVDLTALQPYVAQYSAMTLRSGQLASEAQFRYAGAQQKPALQFSGDVHVANLHTIDNVRQDDFVNWERLDILGMTYQQSPDRLDIAGITARKPYARVTIEPDTSLSVTRVLTAPGSAPRPMPTGAPAPGARSASSSGAAPKRARPGRSRAAAAAVAGSAGASATGIASPAAPATSMPKSIKKIVLQQGTANFTDLSIAPTFSAGIQHLEGTVRGLSSQPNSRAEVDLHGDVDAYSPVSISGEVNLLSAVLYTDISMIFRNIELTIFNPYSGKFAGYNISKGKLTTELHYKVENRKLDAQHHIVIDQLEFGDKTASKDAVSLPVKLAVALLKDRNGVIDLNVPVGGSLDDPSFRLWPIIWKVFVNILEKAVTAPFALLGRLFGAGPDLEYIDFQPGAVAPDAAGSDKIKTVAKALQERPQLKIDVPIGYVPDIDRPALVTAKFNAKLSEVQAARSAKKTAAAAPSPSPWEQLDPATQLELLTKLYTRDVGSAPTYPDTVTAIKQKPDATAAKIEFLTAQIRAHVAVADADLRALGEQRAMTIQQALLTNTQIDPQRVFLVENDKATAKDGVVRLQLSLK